MRILYFHQHFSNTKGSGGTRSYEFAKYAIEAGHDVTIVCGSNKSSDTGLRNNFSFGKREGHINGIKIVEYDLSYSNNDGFIKRSIVFLLFSLRGIKIALFDEYDVIFATSTPLTVCIPGIFARWIRNKKFIFEVRDLWPELPKQMGIITNPIILKALSILEWLAYKSAKKIIGLSPGIIDGIISRGIQREKTLMIPNGCDNELFETDELIKLPNEISEGDFIAVYCGTHGIANGLEILIESAEILLQQKTNNIKILLVGSGMKKANLMIEKNKRRLSNIIFLDPIEKDEIPKLLNSCDLGLQILANIPGFYYGTSPNKFFDYLAAGIPVLVNYPGWMKDLIQKNNCGYFVEPDSPKNFAEILKKASNERTKKDLFKRNSKSLAKRKFDRKKLASYWLNFIES